MNGPRTRSLRTCRKRFATVHKELFDNRLGMYYWKFHMIWSPAVGEFARFPEQIAVLQRLTGGPSLARARAWIETPQTKHRSASCRSLARERGLKLQDH